ncbi:MAG TPA: hypothetical protein VF145_07345 [Chitinophagaceae bacterium]
MKRFVSAVLLIIIFSSCSKQDLVAPEQDAAGTTGKLFYKDANVAISDVEGTAVGNHIRFRFTSNYEKNVAKVELMSGPYENMLCFFYEESLPAVSLQKKSYEVTEQNVSASQRFYVIKYTLRSGGWILTPPFRYQK